MLIYVTYLFCKEKDSKIPVPYDQTSKILTRWPRKKEFYTKQIVEFIFAFFSYLLVITYL